MRRKRSGRICKALEADIIFFIPHFRRRPFEGWLPRWEFAVSTDWGPTPLKGAPGRQRSPGQRAAPPESCAWQPDTQANDSPGNENPEKYFVPWMRTVFDSKCAPFRIKGREKIGGVFASERGQGGGFLLFFLGCDAINLYTWKIRHTFLINVSRQTNKYIYIEIRLYVRKRLDV